MTGAHVLIVTTDWVTGRGCEQILELAGYRVTAYTTAGDVAPADLRGDVPALALIENDIQNIRVARLCESAGVPMVYVHRLLTGDAWHGNTPRLEGRPVAHLITPFNQTQLLNTVATTLGRSSSWSAPSVAPIRAWAHIRSSDKTTQGAQGFTRRQRQIVEMFLDGGLVAKIAQELGLSPVTVRGHLNRIYRKLDTKSQIDLIRAMGRRRGHRGREMRAEKELSGFVLRRALVLVAKKRSEDSAPNSNRQATASGGETRRVVGLGESFRSYASGRASS